MTNTELTNIRNTLSLTKSDFAKLLGVSAMKLGKYEKGSPIIARRLHNSGGNHEKSAGRCGTCLN